MPRHHALFLVSLVLGAAGAACSDDEALAPTPQDITGSYVATTFTIRDSVEHDVLALGGSILLNLEAAGTTTGQLFIPASIAGGTDFTANLTGTYRVTGTTVQYDQGAATFVRDMDFSIVGNTLRGTGTTVTGIVLTVVLTRS